MGTDWPLTEGDKASALCWTRGGDMSPAVQTTSLAGLLDSVSVCLVLEVRSEMESGPQAFSLRAAMASLLQPAYLARSGAGAPLLNSHT